MSPTILAPHAPIPYRTPFINRINADQIGPRYKTETSLDPIVCNAEHAWHFISPMLPALIAGTHPKFGPLARLEFFRDLEVDAIGVALFDGYGHLIAHLLQARLGDHSAASELSNKLLTTIGLDDEDVENIHDLSRGQLDHPVGWLPYLLVVSRQTHVTINGEDLAYPNDEVNDTWTWWTINTDQPLSPPL